MHITHAAEKNLSGVELLQAQQLADEIAQNWPSAPKYDRAVGIYLDAGPAYVLAVMAVLHAGQAPQIPTLTLAQRAALYMPCRIARHPF